MKITWRELAIDLSCQSSDDLLAEWRWLVPATFSLRMVSALGDAFLEDVEGSIYRLDTGAAVLSRIADNTIHFHTLRQQPDYANQWFEPQLVGDLLLSGQILGPDQCFSYRIPPTIGGKVQPDNFHPCNVAVHFRTLGRIQSQVKDDPIGTKYSSVRLGE